MAVRIKSIVFDCADPYRLAQFWLQVTGFSEGPDNGNAPDDPEALLLSPDGSLALLFIAVPEPKHVKNRLHLDLVPLTSQRDEEVGQLLRIGARIADDQRRPDGGGWVVLSDPEGNEFCIERSDSERTPLVEQLGRAFDAIAGLISNIRADQWSAPTPCTDWTVRRLVNHLIGMNRVFAALLAGEPPPPRPSADHVVPARLHCGIVVRVREDVCEILRDGQLCSVRYATLFPSPRTERVSPGHLVAIVTAPDGTGAVVWRWYDAVVLGEEAGLIRLWERSHGEVLAQPRPAYQSRQPGTRAYLSAGLPGADWWVAGGAVASAEDADVELAEVERLYTERDLWNTLV